MASNPYEVFGTDKEVEKKGVIIDYGDFQFFVARAGESNDKFIKAVERRSQPYKRAIQAGTLPEEVARRMLLEVYADAVILDWEGVRDRNGEILPFNRENCIKLLADLPDLFSDLQQQAQNLELFKREEMEEDAKN